jgi:transglutaminase-like putative cysteine protease
MSALAHAPRGPRAPTLLETQRWTATLAAASAFVATAASGDLGPVLVAGGVVSAIGAEIFGGRVAHRWTWAWTALLLAALVLLAGQVLTGQADLVLAAVRFVVLLLLHRLWNRKSLRDEALLLLLSLLLLCGAAALSAEFVFGLAFVAFAVAGTWALALLHLRGEIESGRSLHGSYALLGSRRLATPRLLLALALLSLAGLLGSALVFFAFPRVTIGTFRRVAAGRSIAGLSDRIELGGKGAILDDPRVVLRVRLQPALERDLDFHWRARALDVWTGRGWRSRGGGEGLRRGVPPNPTLLPGRPEMLHASIEALSGFTDGVVLTPPGTVLSVTFPRPLSARPAAVPRVYHEGGSRNLSYAPSEAGDLLYTVTVDRRAPPLSQLMGRGKDYPPEVQIDLALPPALDPRLRELSGQLTRSLDPAEAAVRVESWLSTSLRYTRELAPGGDDPVADFVFTRREGHCELFASAMVLMLRQAGIPARAVSGYYGGKWTGAGYHAVRAGDAHSWVEVYFPGIGFVPFDPTPSAERGSRPDNAWARLVLAWDAVAARWRSTIVDYDLLQQGRLLRSIASTLQDAARRFSGKASHGTMQIPWARLGALAALSLALVVAVRFARRRTASARALAADQRRAAEMWRKARGRLVRAGVALAPGATPREAARRSAPLGPAAQAAAIHLVSRYLQARWGGTPLPAHEARALLRELDRAL